MESIAPFNESISCKENEVCSGRHSFQWKLLMEVISFSESYSFLLGAIPLSGNHFILVEVIHVSGTHLF